MVTLNCVIHRDRFNIMGVNEQRNTTTIAVGTTV